jgi:hypothetical protein
MDHTFKNNPDLDAEALRQARLKKAASDALKEAEQRRKQAQPLTLPPEQGGYENKPEPTRYNDWERKGLICDF